MQNKLKLPFKWKSLLIVIVFGITFWNLPVPDGLTDSAWHTLAFFITVVFSIVLDIMPVGAIGLIALGLFALLNVSGAPTTKGSLTVALSEINSSLIWLIVIAFLIARGFIKTGLGRRVALLLIKYLGKSTLGLAYGLSFADLLLSPAMPSNTARCGGVIYPIVNSLSLSLGSKPNDESRKKCGSFLMLNASNINDITATLFITAYAANPLIVSLASDQNISLSWGGWFLAVLLPASLAFFLMPLIVYKLMPPTLKKTPEARQYAIDELNAMGAISWPEKFMLSTFLIILVLWIFGSMLHIHSTTAAFIGLSLLLLTGVLSWDDVKSEKGAWDTLIWFSALLMMANMLKKLGFTEWFGQFLAYEIESKLGVLPWIFSLLLLNIIYFYVHYLFASGTAQVAALYGVFLVLGINMGIPAFPIAMLLAVSSSLYCSLTQYSHARGPILFGAGFLTTKEWWNRNFIISLITQSIYFVVGLLWWKALGLY